MAAACACGDANVVEEKKRYVHEMEAPENWRQRELAWRDAPVAIFALAKALPLGSAGEEETFKVRVQHLCELGGPDIWRQAVDAYNRSLLWHAVDIEDEHAVEVLLNYGAAHDDRTLHSCVALAHERNMFTIAATLGAPIGDEAFDRGYEDACCTGGAFDTGGGQNWSLFMCCAPQADPEYLTLHFNRSGADGADELPTYHPPPEMLASLDRLDRARGFAGSSSEAPPPKKPPLPPSGYMR